MPNGYHQQGRQRAALALHRPPRYSPAVAANSATGCGSPINS